MSHPTLPPPTALDLVRPARFDRVVSRTLSVLFIVTLLALWLTPWQQTAAGTGSVIAYAPDERRQTLEAPLEGRIARWHVHEGSLVRAGDPVVDLVDNDPNLMQRLEAERLAVVARRDAARDRVRSIGERIEALGASRNSALAAAESRVQMAIKRTQQAERAVELARATLATAQLNLDRQRELSSKGLASRRSYELVELETLRARTELDRAELAWSAATTEQGAVTADRVKLGNDASAALSDARAAQAAAEAEIASANAELARIEVRLTRQATQAITAPKDGTVLRVVANGQAGQLVKAGDVLAVLVPNTSDRAVEAWLSGNDMPLVHEGTRVRVQFEGWPALQFSGWPQVSVGTFAGTVRVLDATDDGRGKFRVLIMPQQASDWPDAKYLRQGVRANAWLQLGRVSLGYELWRLFNGFPPALPEPPAEDKGATK